MSVSSAWKLLARAASSCAIVVLVAAGPILAQGLTTAAVRGRVLDESGAPVVGALISLTNTSNGQRFRGVSREGGRYFVENVAVGGPYTVEARAVGYRPARSEGTRLALGQVGEVNLTMSATAVELGAITVTAAADNPLISASRTGAVSYVTDSAVVRLPTQNRNFTDFIQTVPQVVGTSVGGQNNRFNNIQIDGGVNNDLFGLAASGTPGGQANAHPISLDAVREYQVLIAPFDVRQGGFTGGLVNAITRSGTNELSGSVFGYWQNEDLVGVYTDTAGNESETSEFFQRQYGFTLGGPLVRDRLHFFFVTEYQRRARPFGGLSIGSDPTGGADSVGIGITAATADRVTQILRDQYGFDPGDYTAPSLTNPDRNVFVKLSGQLGSNTQFELSHNYVRAFDDNLIRSPTATGFRDGYQLSNSGYAFTSTTNTTRFRLNTVLGRRFTNELLLGRSTIRDFRDLPNRVPLIFVAGDRVGTNIAAGADRFSQANSLDQDIFEVTDNLTFDVGSHIVTVGTHNEFFGFVNVFFPASIGVWSFSSADSLANGLANRFERAVPGATRPDGPVADFSVQQLGFYVQDRWSPSPRLTVTLGLRVDVPNLDRPPTNLALDSVLTIDTGDFPTGTTLWSPRVGFNFDPAGDGSTNLRGGVGVFSGRPPYVWLSNAYSNTGLEQATLTCTGTQVPAFTVDPAAQPTACAAGAGAVAPTPTINYFDSDFTFPQNMRVALGLDQQLPWGIVGTFDFLYTKSLNQFYITDVNLLGIVGRSAAEVEDPSDPALSLGRPLYGTISSTTGSATVRRRTSRFRDVLRHRNESQDRSYSITGQLQKRFSGGLEFSVGYTYSKTEDLFSLTSSIASSNYRFTALDGTLEDRNLRTSVFDVPHKITASGSMNLPLGVRLSLFYIGRSGSPYTYTVSNDANGDGFGGNDNVYVPRSASDISLRTPSDWTALDAYIESEPCLREQRGRIMERNSCRNPWQTFFNARLSKVVRTVRGQSVEIMADMFNVLSWLKQDWGLVRETAQFEQQSLLTLRGYNTSIGRGIYSLSLPTRERISTSASRWRLQVGARYNY